MNKEELVKHVVEGLYSGLDGSDGSGLYLDYQKEIKKAMTRDYRKLSKKRLLEIAESFISEDEVSR